MNSKSILRREIDGFLQKPFDLRQLLAEVNKKMIAFV